MGISRENSLVLMIDIQERLLPHINKSDELLKSIEIFLQGAKALKLPIVVNEQYKKGLGDTVVSLKEILGEYSSFEKVTFSCCKNETTLEEIERAEKEYVVIFGIETHICVLQTALDLLERGQKVVVVTDCVGSRKSKDTEMAIARMVQAGVIPTTYESILFEILSSAKDEKFKEISKLIK